MQKISKSSKRGMRFMEAYRKAQYKSIFECYKNPSPYKVDAEERLITAMLLGGGDGYRIISHNTMQFVCGWITRMGDLRIETAYNSYIIC